MNVNFNQAVKILSEGGILIFPTDTGFGIGCDATNEKTVKKLFQIRKRDEKKPVPVLFDSIDRVKEFVDPIDQDVLGLMEKHWPGALTIVLKSGNKKSLIL